MVRDIGRKLLDAHAGHLSDCLRHRIKPLPPFTIQSIMIFGEIQFECLHHADDFFLSDLCKTINGVLVRAAVDHRVMHEILSAQEESRALWSSDGLSAAERD